MPEPLRRAPPRARASIIGLTRAAGRLDRIGFCFFAGFYFLLPALIAGQAHGDPTYLRMAAKIALCMTPLIAIAWWATESPTRDARALAEHGHLQVATLQAASVAHPWGVRSTQRLRLVLADGREIDVKNGVIGDLLPGLEAGVPILLDGPRVGVVVNGSVFPATFRKPRSE